jgi:hypothetical protein
VGAQYGEAPYYGAPRVFATFDGRRERNDWVDRKHVPLARGGGRLLLTGDRWAVETDDVDGARNLRICARGWGAWHRGPPCGAWSR